MSLETKAKIICTLIFPVTMYGCKSWPVKKANREKKKKGFHVKRGVRRTLWIMPWTTRKTNKKVLGQIKPETSLETKMTNLKLAFFGLTVKRQGFKEKAGENRRRQE